MDVPVEHTDDGGLRAILIGTKAAFADVLLEQPEGVRVEVERTGPYTPGPAMSSRN